MRDQIKYEGKRVQRHGRKWLTLLTAVVLVAAMSVGGTLAWLQAHTQSVTNTFVMGTVTPEIGEEFNDPYDTKSNITVTNTGTVEAYVRVALVFTWRDGANPGSYEDEEQPTGSIVGVPVTDQDYTFEMGTDWFKGDDGYYYYTEPVGANGVTTSLGTITVNSNSTNAQKYNLDVQVLADSIQSKPTDAVKNTWHVAVDSDGNLFQSQN